MRGHSRGSIADYSCLAMWNVPPTTLSCQAQELPWYQRSTGDTVPENLAIHLADTTGELAHLSQIADLAFIGKSLAPNEGGQTPIEAWPWRPGPDGIEHE